MSELKDYRYFLCPKCGKQLGLYHLPIAPNPFDFALDMWTFNDYYKVHFGYNGEAKFYKSCDDCNEIAIELPQDEWPKEVLQIAKMAVLIYSKENFPGGDLLKQAEALKSEKIKRSRPMLKRKAR